MNTDEHELPPEPETDADAPVPVDEASDRDALLNDDLAGFSLVADETIQAVDTLYGGIPPLEGEYTDEYETALAIDSVNDAAVEQEAEPEFVLPAFEPALPMPPMTRLRRGQLGSLVPALLLIAIGAWLTLTTTAGTPPDPLLVAGAAVGGVVLSLLAQWVSTGRWGRGYFFFAVLVLLVAGLIAFALQPNGLSIVRGWPALIIALGAAVFLSGLLARPANRRLLTPGILLIIAGLLSMIVTNNVLPQRLLVTASLWAPAVLIALVVIWLLPLVFRRRG